MLAVLRSELQAFQVYFSTSMDCMVQKEVQQQTLKLQRVQGELLGQHQRQLRELLTNLQVSYNSTSIHHADNFFTHQVQHTFYTEH